MRFFIACLLAMQSSIAFAQEQNTRETAQLAIDWADAIINGDAEVLSDAGILSLWSDVGADGELTPSDDLTDRVYLTPMEAIGLLESCKLNKIEALPGSIGFLWVCDEQSTWRSASESKDGNDKCYVKAHNMTAFYISDELRVNMTHVNFWDSLRCRGRIQKVPLPRAPQQEGSE